MTDYKTGKIGSSRRKGDEYQDLTALRIALENYIARQPFELYLEYEKVGNLDDIVLFRDQDCFAYQVKFSVNPLEVYVLDDFISSGSPVFFKKFADSWNKVHSRFPKLNITASLCSNRGVNASFVNILNPDGTFLREFIDDRKRGCAKGIRTKLQEISCLESDNFKEFLADFQFSICRPSLKDLEQQIQINLLDKELGISDKLVFLDLKEIVKKHAIYSREPITIEYIDNALEHLQSKLLIPQVFPINKAFFVEQKSFSEQLNKTLSEIDRGYIIATGLPGSGKSTSLTSYFDTISREKYEVFSYYCFVGINDNAQKMRVKAECLHANLLNEFRRRYPNIIKRKYDNSEINFLESLNILAKAFCEEGRRFIIFLDGLDHAERFDSQISDTVISALPANIPQGMVIVVGTQELHKWPHFIKQTRENSETHIEMPLFSEPETEEYLVTKRGISGLSHADINIIHNKCEGLPLYLQYIAELFLSGEISPETISSINPAIGGDIRKYYELLWEEFENVGMGHVKHLCAVMACLQFAIHRDELFDIQKSLNRPQFEEAYKCISHLLRKCEDRLSIFHDSFRAFVLSQLSGDWILDIKSSIVKFLQKQKNSPRWFKYIFESCYEVKNYTYLLEEVNAAFVENALQHYRPTKEIMDAIDFAIDSALNLQDIVSLSRLGALKSKTRERLEDNFDRPLLAKTLLALGREQDVISCIYSSEENRLIIDKHTSITIISELANKGKLEIAEKLFKVFSNEFRGINSEDGDNAQSLVTDIAHCLGTFPRKIVRHMRWLSLFKFTPDILEQEDTYTPGYAPHLAAYINALVQFNHTDIWNRIKRVRKLFPNNLVNFYLIRSLAQHNNIKELQEAITEYTRNEEINGNIELAYYAAKAGKPVGEVSAIAGAIVAPSIDQPGDLSKSNPILMNYAFSFTVLGYEASESSYAAINKSIPSTPSLWFSSLKHTLKACYCLGKSFRNNTLWYTEACESIDALINAEQGDGERICDSIDIIRKVLLFTIGNLTEQIINHFPSQLDDWIGKLSELRNSLLWTTHYGIMECRRDYDFELKLWDNLANNPLVQPKLISVLKSCAATYEKSTNIKGSCRFAHFMWLSKIMAKCGMHNDSGKWFHYAICSSLMYGYHKDVTLSYLIDILNIINCHQPERALERSARILSMVKWMPDVTDERETKWFIENIFSAILKINRNAAFDLIMHFNNSIASWQMLNCLKEYILNSNYGDPEFLWSLSELFPNHYTDAGRHGGLITESRHHIVAIVHKSSTEDIKSEFDNRLRNFILTEVTPRHWPESLKKEFSIVFQQKSNNDHRLSELPSSLMLNGTNVNQDDIIKMFNGSCVEFSEILKKLKEENKNFYERDLLHLSISNFVKNANSSEELFPIKDYMKSEGRFHDSKIVQCLIERFTEFGDQGSVVECLELAFSSCNNFSRWRNNTKYLIAIAQINRDKAVSCLLNECYVTTNGSNGGYDTPPVAAFGLNDLGEVNKLEAVFDNYLVHCESMFKQLPNTEEYKWLKNYTESPLSENQKILQLVIENLNTPEIDHGERLIKTLTNLALSRPDEVIPTIISKSLSATGITFRRLIIILQAIANKKAILLYDSHQDIAKLLELKNFFCRQTVMNILDRINEIKTLSHAALSEIKTIKRKYSSSVSYPSYRLPSSPSPEFLSFFKNNPSIGFYKHVCLIEKIIGIKVNTLVAAIENNLLSIEWSISEERSHIKDNWNGYVHPQGWPVIWITTDFHEQCVNFLDRILNEVAEKMKLSGEQLDLLWKVVNTNDPLYIMKRPIKRPSDIQRFVINDKDTWFKELDSIENFQIGDTSLANKEMDWITIFERKTLAQDETYNIPFKQIISTDSGLIPKDIYRGAYDLDEVRIVTELIVPNIHIPVTFNQAYHELSSRGSDVFNADVDTLPLIAKHFNSPIFVGYKDVCTLSSFIINDFNLSFDDLKFVRNGEIVSRYEYWQEGYQDESYTSEKLSYGTRLVVSKEFIAEICRYYKKILCIKTEESREYYESIYHQEADESRNSRRYIIYHF